MSTNARFMTTGSGGKVHHVTTKTVDMKVSTCPVVKKGHIAGTWGRKKGVSPEAAIALDECSRCRTHAVAQSLLAASKTPEQKRAEAQAEAEATRRSMSPAKKQKQAKEPKSKGSPKAERRGPSRRGVESMRERADEHLKIAQDNNWVGKVLEDKVGVTVEAEKDGQTLRLVYQDGRIISSRVVLANGTDVNLRNSAGWRRHASGESKLTNGYQPRTRKSAGKKAAKREEQVEETLGEGRTRKLPFNVDDDDETILNALRGHMISWRMTMGSGIDSAVVPVRSRNVRITQHPKSMKRIISFHEMQGNGDHGELLGGERFVYIDKIVRVR